MHPFDWIESPALREKYICCRHSSGLTLMLYPNRAYSSVTACYSAHYGSADNLFVPAPGEKPVAVPEGIAHFLEHKLFEDEDGDAFEKFGRTGAFANAFTSFDKTAFYFTCTDRFRENLEILLNFVQSPYFTAETVQKEQGIIGQEIRMYDDDPDWQVLFGMLQGMYARHSIRIDTAGTVESIARITPELLYSCYRTFYRPGNMVLSVAGNFDPETVLSCCDRLIRPAEPFEVQRMQEEEPVQPLTGRKVRRMPVSKPQFCIGFKQEPAADESDRLRDFILDKLASNCLYGDTTDFYRRHYQSGLINSCFGSSVWEGTGFLTLLCEGESDDCDAVAAAMQERIRETAEKGIDPDILEGARRAAFGKQVSLFADPSELAMQMVDACFGGYSLFATSDLLRSVRPEEVNRFIQTRLDPERITVSILQSEA